MFIKSYIALGSNLKKPLQQIDQGLDGLSKLQKSNLICHSNYYKSKTIGPDGQPDTINAVALLETELSPFELLKALHKLEEKQGRIRTVRWGPRIIDLDIILYGNYCIDTPKLTIPHKESYKRDFVLLPLSEIVPDLYFPTGENVSFLASKCTTKTISVIKKREKI